MRSGRGGFINWESKPIGVVEFRAAPHTSFHCRVARQRSKSTLVPARDTSNSPESASSNVQRGSFQTAIEP